MISIRYNYMSKAVNFRPTDQSLKQFSHIKNTLIGDKKRKHDLKSVRKSEKFRPKVRTNPGCESFRNMKILKTFFKNYKKIRQAVIRLVE